MNYPAFLKPLPLALTTALLLTTSCVENQTPPGLQDYQPGPAPVLDCLPNLDGRIDASELQAAIGVPVSYRISPSGESRPVDLRGLIDQNGIRVWDWSLDDASDQRLEIAASELHQKWYASSFPGGEFVTLLNPDLDLEAIYSHDEEGLHFHGYASRQESPSVGQTLVVYDQPVTLYPFPLEVGRQWTSTGTVRNATVQGLPYAGVDTYESNVDASGELWLPELRFQQVLRVNTKVTINPSIGAPQSHRQTSFFFECFGEVARAVSAPGTEDPEFNTAVEMRRLGF